MKTINPEKLKELLSKLIEWSELDKNYLSNSWPYDLLNAAFPEAPVEKWRPEPGEGYWYFDSALESDFEYNTEDIIDTGRIDANNCFPTEQSCQEAIEKIKKVLAE